jgi:phage/plasmid-like protein (TIGR03299 family)
MAHNIEIAKDGRAKMAYSNREIPWHRLGKPMDKDALTAEQMLVAAQADFDVVLASVAAIDAEGNMLRNPDGTPVVIDDSRATVRVNPDGTFDGLSTVGTRFVVQQNREVLDRALDVVGASKGDAVVDTVGVLDGGREFFACIDLGGLIIDPTGVNDQIERFLLVRNGHNGKTPITFANTSIRTVCKNTVIAGLDAARSVFTARHTRNADSAMEEAQTVLRMSTEWATEFSRTAEKLLTIPMNPVKIDKVISNAFPKKTQETQRQEENREQVWAVVRDIYRNSNNAGGYGENGWSMLNAVGEYLDHYRDADMLDRANASMNMYSWVSKTKVQSEKFILSLV